MVKASDMMVARRADTRARADFATWRMMAKLNGADSLTSDAQAFLADYQKLLKETTDENASDATINLIYKSYYKEMGGLGAAPDVKIRAKEPTLDNVMPLKRPDVRPTQKAANFSTAQKPPLPVALIFICLVAVVVGFRYFLR